MNCQYTHLEQEALLHIIGPDTLKFLQGQTTCDTRKVTPSHAVPGVFCTPQGRVVCDFLLCELGQDHFALRLRRDIRARSSTTFGKYIIFSKAKLDDTREDWAPYAVWGQDAANALGKIFGELPSARFGSTRGDGFVLVQTDEQGQQFECYLLNTSNGAHLARMDEMMTPGSETQWQALQIANGIARIEAATVEEFVPQILNYDHTGHISFNKGCYTGQEVVARLHYLGKPKRRTYVAELPFDDHVRCRHRRVRCRYRSNCWHYSQRLHRAGKNPRASGGHHRRCGKRTPARRRSPSHAGRIALLIGN